MERVNRTYEDLEKIMNEHELDKFASDLGTSYATSSDEFTRSYYTRQYQITSECFYKLRDRSIVRDLVPDEIVDKMREKSYRNSNARSMELCGQRAVTSHVHYAKLLGERKWFKFLRDFSEEDKIKITTYFAENFEVSKAECAEKFNLSTIELGKIIEDTLLRSKVDDKIFSKIRKRSLGDKPTKTSVRYFATLKRRRNKMKKATEN